MDTIKLSYDDPLHIQLIHQIKREFRDKLGGKGYGVNPVALTKDRMSDLASWGYWFAPKDNGDRRMLLSTKIKMGSSKDPALVPSPCHAMIDRSMNIELIHLSCHSSLYNGTLLDGELMGGEYRVFDIYCFCGTMMTNYALQDRIVSAGLAVVKFSASLGTSSFSISLKKFRPLSAIRGWKLADLCNKKVDGLILMRNQIGPKIGVDFDTFKWKPRILSTVDFWVSLSDKPDPRLVPASFNEMEYVPVSDFDYGDDDEGDSVMTPAKASPSPEDHKDTNKYRTVTLSLIDKSGQFQSRDSDGYSLECFCSKTNLPASALDDLAVFGYSVLCMADVIAGIASTNIKNGKAGAVFECILVPETNQWKPILFRGDKPMPNLTDVAQQTLESIERAVDFGEIAACC